MEKKLRNYFVDDELNGNEHQKIINSALSSDNNCVTADQFRLKVFKPKLSNRNKALGRVNDMLNTLDVSQLSSVMVEFNQYLSDGRYVVTKAEFKNDMLPRLQSFICGKEGERKKFYALCLLLRLLFDEFLSKKSKLAKVAVKASLVSTLIQISSQSNADLSAQKAVYALLAYLFFLIDSKKERVIKNLILSDIEIFLTSNKRAQKENYETSLDAIWLLQFFPLWSKDYGILEPLLTTLKTLIDHKDNRVVSESCYTLAIFARNCVNARIDIVKDKKLCKRLVELLQMRTNCSAHLKEDVITPIVCILAVILPNRNAYRKVFVENGLLTGVKNLIINGCHCYRRYGCDIIKWLCITPLCERLNKPIELIDSILDCDVMPLLNHVIDHDLNVSAKYSALYAIFTLTYNASYDQMVKLSNQGTIKSLCAQLTSSDNAFVHLVLVTLTNFLVCDFMEKLMNQQFPYPVEKLSKFAEIIKSNDGINLLTLINKRADIDGVKEIGKNKVFAQDLLAYGLGIELREPRKIPTAVMMDYNLSRQDCMLCNKTIADTCLFVCEHNVFCKPCASKLLYKILVGEKPNECPVKDCKKEAKLNAAPFGGIRGRMHCINKDIEKEVEGEFVNEYPPIRKANVTNCSII